jgi:HEAT repeat protein
VCRMIPNFGALALPALPALLKALRDPDENVRDLATYAVRELAPEVLTNAPGR